MPGLDPGDKRQPLQEGVCSCWQRSMCRPGPPHSHPRPATPAAVNRSSWGGVEALLEQVAAAALRELRRQLSPFRITVKPMFTCLPVPPYPRSPPPAASRFAMPNQSVGEMGLKCEYVRM